MKKIIVLCVCIVSCLGLITNGQAFDLTNCCLLISIDLDQNVTPKTGVVEFYCVAGVVYFKNTVGDTFTPLYARSQFGTDPVLVTCDCNNINSDAMIKRKTK